MTTEARQRCEATTAAGTRCTHLALPAGGRCRAHGGLDVDTDSRRPERTVPCRCPRPAWVDDGDGPRCVSCGRAPVTALGELADWLRRWPDAGPADLTAHLRGLAMVKRANGGHPR